MGDLDRSGRRVPEGLELSADVRNTMLKHWDEFLMSLSGVDFSAKPIQLISG